jgi:hypothetical protein
MQRNDPGIPEKEPSNPGITELLNETNDGGPPETLDGQIVQKDPNTRQDAMKDPLADTRVHILDEILHTNLATRPQEPERHITLGPNVNEWCRYHRCKGHDTER